MFTKNKEDVKAREAELSAQGQYFSASYAAERGSRSKEESGEKGGAAVIPICLPLCCAVEVVACCDGAAVVLALQGRLPFETEEDKGDLQEHQLLQRW